MNCRRILGLACIAAAVAVAGCPSKKVEPTAPVEKGASFKVYKDKKWVQLIKNEPGYVAKQFAEPPAPGSVLPQHPFLTATSLDSNEEPALDKLLSQARSFEEYVDLLKSNEYKVERLVVPAPSSAPVAAPER